jgi:hydroxymethylpyrimidine/phosphomethylpyrimidine kinase
MRARGAETAMRLNQVTLAVSDMAPCTRFYEALGARLIVDSAPRYQRFEWPGGETLSLHHEPGWTGADWPLVYLEVDDLDACCDRLKARGVVFESEPKDQSWLWREADIRDPAGNRLRLYQAGDNRRFPPWRVDSARSETDLTGG